LNKFCIALSLAQRPEIENVVPNQIHSYASRKGKPNFGVLTHVNHLVSFRDGAQGKTTQLPKEAERCARKVGFCPSSMLPMVGLFELG
jgi:hypothetical protein